MTWPNRLRLFVGLIFVFALVAACTVVFTQRQSRAESTTASMTAQEYEVGAVYAGTVTAAHVVVGDEVATGDVLFEVRSPALARDLATDAVTAADLGVDVTTDGTYTVTATIDGTVSEATAPVGDFVPSGAVIARIQESGSLAVSAEFTLTARDYGRIEEGSVVDLRLPDDRTIVGKVDAIDVDTVAGRATSIVTVESTALAAHQIGGLFQPGTPVVATLHLRQDGALAGVTDAVGDFLRRIGL